VVLGNEALLVRRGIERATDADWIAALSSKGHTALHVAAQLDKPNFLAALLEVRSYF